MKVSISERLKELRADLKMNQSDFASLINTNQSTLSAYENGERFPPYETLIAITQHYHISLDWLCGLSEIKYLNNGIETYSDVFRLLSLLSITTYLDTNENILQIISTDSSVQFISNYNEEFNHFFSQCNKMIELLNSGTIDKELYDIWLEKELAKYNKTLNQLPFS